MMENIYDKSNMKAVLNAFPEQIKEAYTIEPHIVLKGMIDKIIICGMGGSSIGGQLLASYMKDISNLQVINVQDYELPVFADKNTLVIVSSYSGNTEESLSCYKQCLKKELNVIALTTGGKLAEYANSNRKSLIIVPKGLQPRNAIAFMFFPILKMFEDAGIISSRSASVKNLISTLKSKDNHNDSLAQELASKLSGKLPLIQSSARLHSVAYRWKTQINENAKIPAFCSTYPELDHNELTGYNNLAQIKVPLHIIILKDEYESKRMLKRMELTKKMIKETTGNKIEFTDITIKGEDSLTRMFSSLYLGDLMSYYLALNYATDPMPVEIIEKFKKELGPYIV